MCSATSELLRRAWRARPPAWGAARRPGPPAGPGTEGAGDPVERGDLRGHAPGLDFDDRLGGPRRPLRAGRSRTWTPCAGAPPPRRGRAGLGRGAGIHPTSRRRVAQDRRARFSTLIRTMNHCRTKVNDHVPQTNDPDRIGPAVAADPHGVRQGRRPERLTPEQAIPPTTVGARPSTSSPANRRACSRP